MTDTPAAVATPNNVIVASKEKEASMVSLPDSRQLTLQPYIFMCAIFAAIAAFNAGFSTGVPNIPEKSIRACSLDIQEAYSGTLPACLPMNDWTWGVAVGLYALGGLPGGLLAGFIANKIGRRDALLCNNFFFIVGGVLISTSPHIVQFTIGRFLTGVGSGFACVVVSMYCAEISTIKYRGAIGTVLQLMLVTGILISQALGLSLSSSVSGWRWLFSITVVGSLFQLLLLPLCVRSPRWLISKNRIDEAMQALKRLRKGYDITEEFSEMVNAQQQDKEGGEKEGKHVSYNAQKTLNVFELLSNPALVKTALLVMVVHGGSQISGINGVMYFSTSIFDKSFGSAAPSVTVGIGCLNLVMTLISSYLIDRAGRRMLLLTSTCGMSVMSTLMVIASVLKIDALVVVSVMLFVASFAIGLGTVPWLIVAELFPTYAVGAASSLAMGINWFCNFIVGLVFPTLKSALGDYTFVVFAVTNMLLFLFTFFLIPETKGVSLEKTAGITKEVKNEPAVLSEI
ncbi:uncharacterized protein VTP21DRAFT_9841 [Calcarisporiella thermophila]|uniref:uncharacterized protein n=1 Tax=Calcarisporiella thermophila TaxID=911321 RepID=UPI003742F355